MAELKKKKGKYTSRPKSRRLKENSTTCEREATVKKVVEKGDGINILQKDLVQALKTPPSIKPTDAPEEEIKGRFLQRPF